MTAKNKADLKLAIDNAFPTNGVGSISATDLRTYLKDAVDSELNTEETADVSISGLSGNAGKHVAVNGTGDGLELVSVSVYGSEYSYIESESEDTTSSTSFQNKVTLTTGTIPAGDYHIVWSYELRSSNSEETVKSQVLVDTVEIGSHIVETKDGNEYRIVSGFRKMTLTNAVHTVDIEYARDSGGTAKIRRARIELYRVA